METIASDARFRGASTQNAKKLITARVSTSGLDDLLLLDAVSRQIHIISQPKTEGMPTPEIASLDVDGGPLALLTVRLNHDAMDDLVILRLGASQPSIVMTAPTTVITVNDAGDQPGNCGGGTCTLRSAIIAANGLPGSTIAFNIPGGGVHTISPFSELPVVRTAVTIDGSTQPGYAGTPVIEIKGNNFQAGQAIDGLKIRASNCSVYGLAINEFPGSQDPDTGSVTGGNGLTLESTTLSPNNGHNFIQGNFLGTAPNGLVSKGNRSTGILVFSSGSNTINGNLMSGNGGFGLDVTAGNGNLIIANRIGVAADGHTKLGNTNGVFLTGSNNEFGGDAPNYGNTVSE